MSDDTTVYVLHAQESKGMSSGSYFFAGVFDNLDDAKRVGQQLVQNPRMPDIYILVVIQRTQMNALFSPLTAYVEGTFFTQRTHTDGGES